MSRTRYNLGPHETAATYRLHGSGCFPGFVLPPLAILVFGIFLYIFVINAPYPDTVVSDTNASAGSLSPLFTSEVQYWNASILRWAAASGVDTDLAAVVMQIESCGDPYAVSSAGAIGLFQVMPYHFYITDNPYDPDTNAARGLAYLRRALEVGGGDISLSLAGYNGGISLAGFGQLAWPAETNRYVYWGTGIYEDAKNGAAQSERLNEWLKAGGASLCARAHASLNLP